MAAVNHSSDNKSFENISTVFLRWKERFFILTNDYFHCFKKGSFKMTEMGEFIFKVTETINEGFRSLLTFHDLGETEFHQLCVFIGQKGIPDNLPDSGLHQGGQDLPEEGGGPQGMVLSTKGGRGEPMLTNCKSQKNLHCSSMWIKRNPLAIPPTPSYPRPN